MSTSIEYYLQNKKSIGITKCANISKAEEGHKSWLSYAKL